MADRVVRIVIAGDATSGLRALRQTETASIRTGRELEKSGKEAELAGERFGRMGKGVGLLRGTVAQMAGLAGLGGLGLGIKDAVKAGTAWQAQQAQLQSALKATGNAAMLDKVNKAAEFSATHGGFSATTELAGITQFVTETHSATQAIKDNTAVVDVARRLNVDYSQATSIVARAQAGATGKLQQYLGIIIPVKTHMDALTQAHKVNALQLELQSKALGKAGPLWLKEQMLMAGITPAAKAQALAQDKLATARMVNARILQYLGGATTAFSHTTAGALSNAQNAYEALSVKIGTAFQPAIKWAANEAAGLARTIVADWPQIRATVKQVFADVKPILVDAVHAIRDVGNAFLDVVHWFAKNKAAVDALGTAVGIVASAFLGLKAAMAWKALLSAMVDGFWALDAAMAANPVGLIVTGVALLAAGLVYAYEKSKTFRDIVGEAFKIAEVGANLFLTQLNGVIAAIDLLIKGINLVIGLYDSIPSALRPTGKIGKIGEIGQIGLIGGSILAPVLGGSSPHSSPHKTGGGVPGLNLAGSLQPVIIHNHMHVGPREVSEEITRYNLTLATRR